MKKVRKLEDIPINNDLTPEEFEQLVKDTLFKTITPEEQEEINKKLPKSLRKKSNEKK